MKKISTILFTIIIIASIISPVFADNPDQAEGLTVSPPLAELNFDPGQIYQKQIKLNNPTKNIIEMYPVARNFTATDETGTPTIETPTSDATYGLASWISFGQSKVVLTPDQESIFNYTITVPPDAEPGGHYAAVLFASNPPKADQSTTQVALASMVGTLVLGTVSGSISQSAQVREFTTDKLIYIKPYANFILRIANTGNVHIKPIGEISIKNWGRIVATIDANASKGNVLPNSTRRFDNLNYIGKWYSFGLYSATYTATYGTKNLPLTSTVNFWIIPIWLIVTLAVIVLLIIFIIIRKRKKNRKKNKSPETRYIPPSPPEPTKKRIIIQ